MLFSKARIQSQSVLLKTRKRAAGICLLTAGGKLIFSFSLTLCVYSMFALPGYAMLAENIWLLAGAYALFALGAVFSVFFFAMTDFAQKRWFYWNASAAQPLTAFFQRVAPMTVLRLFYLFLLRRLLACLTFLAYLSPFALGCGILYYHMRGAGISPLLFYAALVLLVCLLLGGIYYGFAAVQRYAFCTCLIVQNPSCRVIDALTASRKIAKDTAISAARTKLHFLLWFALCVLILPAFYVVPYYRQTVGCMEKTALDKNHLTPKTQKPIVLLHLIQKPA